MTRPPTTFHDNLSVPTSISASATAALHPIEALIERAEKEFESLLKRETRDLESAAAAYRHVRGRHPPPGFDAWHSFAVEHGAIIIEEFWDQIYHDLSPFWAVAPSRIRADARGHGMVVKIENGKAESNTGWFWHAIWAHLINTVSEYLPDMVVPLNSMDEPRIMAPWEKINEYITAERASRDFTPAKDTVAGYNGWREEDVEDGATAIEVEWLSSTPYSLSHFACPPESAIRQPHSVTPVSYLLQNITHLGSILAQASANYASAHSFSGFVANYTLSADICHQPDLGGLHGALMHPLTARSSRQLIPLFGGSKLTVNNDILLPAPMYWSDEERFSGGIDPGTNWKEKQSSAVWRGTASGGHNTPTNWRQFHRHRFVAMTNGTKYRVAKDDNDLVFTPKLRVDAIEGLQSPVRKHFDTFLTNTTDIAFTDLMCEIPEADSTCFYTSDEFKVAEKLPLKQQFGYKYLPDIDGNSFSGRYRAFLLSTSLPIKATMYREWHDSRLVAWKHFVPMDNRFHDFYGIMEFFRGFDGVGHAEAGPSEAVEGHDAMAEKIALEGREWANQVLRKEDMAVYVLRLLLEYARLTDDRRYWLGYVDDLGT